MDDNEIIGMYHKRDENAIAETDRKHGAFCRSLAKNILSDFQDAEECVNDTWLAAWNSMPPDWPASLKAFLGRITRNISISRFRKKHASKRYAGIEIMLSELSECVPGCLAEKELERHAVSEAISLWLDTLSQDERNMFVRRYWYGEQLKDIAAEYKISANRAAQKMQRLRAGLRLALEKEGIDI